MDLFVGLLQAWVERGGNVVVDLVSLGVWVKWQ